MSALEGGVRDLVASKLRLGSRYRLVVLDRLSDDELELLGGIRDSPDLYGVLRPLAGGTFKAVHRDLALVLLTLREPGPLPSFYKRDRSDAELRREVTALLADGVLEIAIDGEFRTGGAALDALDEIVADDSGTELARKSVEALRYGSTLGLCDPRSLAERLYRFGCLPVSPFWMRSLPDPDAVLRALGDPQFMGWKREGPSSRRPWITWSRRGTGAVVARGRPGYKLYVSPMPGDLPAVFEVLPEAAGRYGALQLKVGAAARGLLRTDKLVLYFAERDELAETAHWLDGRLDGVAVHGVPFSSQTAARGLLSWGIDPPAEHPALGGPTQSSWRSWLTERLAVALLEADRAAEEIEPWRWAMSRVRLEGIDIEHWTPGPELWSYTATEGEHVA